MGTYVSKRLFDTLKSLLECIAADLIAETSNRFINFK